MKVIQLKNKNHFSWEKLLVERLYPDLFRALTELVSQVLHYRTASQLLPFSLLQLHFFILFRLILICCELKDIYSMCNKLPKFFNLH